MFQLRLLLLLLACSSQLLAMFPSSGPKYFIWASLNGNNNSVNRSCHILSPTRAIFLAGCFRGIKNQDFHPCFSPLFLKSPISIYHLACLFFFVWSRRELTRVAASSALSPESAMVYMIWSFFIYCYH